ncbi:MAG TPA: malonic semialdehyde reductase [Bryobacteraceae bacterium]|jgi:3-hydroxypropanoate dehydrogenase|nr:malonic semialdehyde reductase [Bryobacteraceae bacterium]
MSRTLDSEALDVLFRQARTYTAWGDEPVSDDTLRQLYDLMKFGPTSMNSSPARILFLRSKKAKERLKPALSPGNIGKTMDAPVTAIVAYDTKFYDHLPKLFPQGKGARDNMANNPQLAEITAFRNGTLGGAYFIMAARACGLDCGPMSGFDNAKVDAEFFAGESWKSNFLCNLGHGDPSTLYPRNPRLDFDEACKLL